MRRETDAKWFWLRFQQQSEADAARGKQAMQSRKLRGNSPPTPHTVCLCCVCGVDGGDGDEGGWRGAPQLRRDIFVLCHRGPYPLNKSLLLTLLCFHLHSNSSLCKNLVMETIRSLLEGAAKVFTHSPHVENIQKWIQILQEFCNLPRNEGGRLSSLISRLFLSSSNLKHFQLILALENQSASFKL